MGYWLLVADIWHVLKCVVGLARDGVPAADSRHTTCLKMYQEVQLGMEYRLLSADVPRVLKCTSYHCVFDICDQEI